eukprot:3961206-Ditylum_brightwellii.AAC.1
MDNLSSYQISFPSISGYMAMDPASFGNIPMVWQAAHTNHTERTVKATDQLLNYLATYLNAVVHFHANTMILYIHSSGAYMVMPEARSQAGGHFSLGTNPP